VPDDAAAVEICPDEACAPSSPSSRSWPAASFAPVPLDAAAPHPWHVRARDLAGNASPDRAGARAAVRVRGGLAGHRRRQPARQRELHLRLGAEPAPGGEVGGRDAAFVRATSRRSPPPAHAYVYAFQADGTGAGGLGRAVVRTWAYASRQRLFDPETVGTSARPTSLDFTPPALSPAPTVQLAQADLGGTTGCAACPARSRKGPGRTPSTSRSPGAGDPARPLGGTRSPGRRPSAATARSARSTSGTTSAAAVTLRLPRRGRQLRRRALRQRRHGPDHLRFTVTPPR
jgi:hypothetical protein